MATIRPTSRVGQLAAGMLALGLSVGGCAAASETDESSEAMKSFLQAPSQSGAHGQQSDPHASLGPQKMVQVALQHLDESRTQLALDTLNAAIAKYPDNAMLLSVRASVFLQDGRTSFALADLNRAVAIEPHDPVLLTNRAQALRQFGRKDNARRDLDRALELEPDFIAALFNRGSLLFEAEKYAEALIDFDRCILLEPEVPAAWFNRASAYEAMGQRERAIGDLKHFLSLSPQPSWAQIARDLLKQWESDQS